MYLGKCPVLNKQPIDLYTMYTWVVNRGGFKSFTKKSQWKESVGVIDNYDPNNGQAPYILCNYYEKYLLQYEEYYHSGPGETTAGGLMGDIPGEQKIGAPIGVIDAAVPSKSLDDDSTAVDTGEVAVGSVVKSEIGNTDTTKEVVEKSTDEKKVEDGSTESDGVKFASLESIPTFESSVLNLKSWTGILSCFMKEMNILTKDDEFFLLEDDNEEDEIEDSEEGDEEDEDDETPNRPRNVHLDAKSRAALEKVEYLSYEPSFGGALLKTKRSASKCASLLRPVQECEQFLRSLIMHPISGKFFDTMPGEKKVYIPGHTFKDEKRLYNDATKKPMDLLTIWKRFRMGYYFSTSGGMKYDLFEADCATIWTTWKVFAAGNNFATWQQADEFEKLFQQTWSAEGGRGLKQLCQQHEQLYRSLPLPGERVMSPYGPGVIIEAYELQTKCVVELDWRLAGGDHPTLYCLANQLVSLETKELGAYEAAELAQLEDAEREKKMFPVSASMVNA